MTKMPHGMSRYDTLLKEALHNCDMAAAPALPQVFGYLLGRNPITGNLDHAEIVEAFIALVDGMQTSALTPGPAEAGQTFFGQFIDHDITLDATSQLGTHTDPATIRNVRTPNLDLDCVYGDGPEASPHLYAQSPDQEGFLLLGREGSPNDLPRNDKGRALIGDPRNDENILVSQIQGAFIKLHNILMSKVEDDAALRDAVFHCAEDGVRSEVWHRMLPEGLERFEKVRRFIRLHYQWLVLHDFLPAFVDQTCIDLALRTDPFGPDAPIMPAEFSVAAYRFGHATVQPTYDINGHKKAAQLFDLHGFGPRGPEWDMDMSLFFGTQAQKALPVGPKMAKTLFALPDNVAHGDADWNGVKIAEVHAKKLGLRNILRDRTTIQLPSGQQVSRYLGLPELPAPAELAKRHITKTPLWFYCLQEAHERGDGKLTGVGGTIVASVFARLLKLDRESVLHLHGFRPWGGFGPKFSCAAMMEYVDGNAHAIHGATELYCGPATEKVAEPAE